MKYSIKIIYLNLWAALFFMPLLPLWAQMSSMQYKFDKLTFKDGLSQNTVTSLCQDERGFLWFGTQDGLNRYDGYSFVNYKNDAEDTTSIAGNFVRAILKDRDGQMWVAANGLNLFDRKKETFKRFRHNPKVKNTLPSNVIFCIYQDRKDNIWIGTNNGLSLVQKHALGNYSFKNFFHNPKKTQSLADNSVYCIFEDNKGRLWVGTDGGLSCMDTRGEFFNNFRHDPTDSSSLVHKSVRSIWQDRSNTLWVATPQGLSRMNTHSLSAGIFTNYNSKNTPNLLNDNFYSVFSDKDNSIWLGSAEGLFKVLPISDSQIDVQHFLTNPSNKSMPYDNIRCMLEDKSGVLWFGTYNEGIRKLDKNRLKFQLYEHNPYLSSTLSHSDVSCLYEEGNTLWVGTNYDGLNLMTNNEGNISFRKLPQVGNIGIRCLARTRDGHVWVGTNGNGLFEVNAQNSAKRYAFSGGGGISSNTVQAIFEDSKGNLWISTASGIDLRTNGVQNFIRFASFDQKNRGFEGGEIIQFYEDRKGYVWLASSNGLYRYDRSNDKFSLFKHDPAAPNNSIPGNAVRTIAQDIWGDLWIGTQTGLCKYLSKTGQFIVLGTESDNLLSNEIMGIIPDEKGFLWISTAKGLIKFDVQSENYRLYDSSDGLQAGEFNTNAYHRGRSGRFYFGGTAGFNAFYPQQIKNNTAKMQPIITALYVFNHLIDFKKRKDILDANITETEVIELNYDDRAFSLDFSAMQYADPEKNSFLYRLDGFEDSWAFTGADSRFASYENLPPGEYTFLLRASNSDGVWCDEATSLKVIINQPFWQSWWFKALLLCLLALVLWGGLRLHSLNQITKRLKDDLQMKDYALNIEQRRFRNQLQTQEQELFYAKYIQETILPREQDITRFFDDCFVLYKPKNIVGGDFFWLTQQNGKVITAVVDCSGSGTPGAFISLIVNHHLHQIVSLREITEPALILKFLHRSLQMSMVRSPEHSFEGIDISVCTLDSKSRKVLFAGAKHQFVYIQNDKVTVLKGNKQPVGGGRGWEKLTHYDFEQHELPYQSRAVCFMYTDGYADQFGGDRSKKIKLQPFRDLLKKHAGLSMQEQKEHLENYLSQWSQNKRHEQTDDILVTGFRLM